MRARSLRRALYPALLLALPVPYYIGTVEVAPAARLLFLAGLALWVAAQDGVANYQTTLTQLAAGQALLWLLLLYGGAALLAALVARLVPERARLPLFALAVLGLALAGLFPIYRTDLSSRGTPSTLLGLFD